MENIEQRLSSLASPFLKFKMNISNLSGLIQIFPSKPQIAPLAREFLKDLICIYVEVLVAWEFQKDLICIYVEVLVYNY